MPRFSGGVGRWSLRVWNVSNSTPGRFTSKTKQIDNYCAAG